MDTFYDHQAQAWVEIREWSQEAQALYEVQEGGSWDGPGSAVSATTAIVKQLPNLLYRVDAQTFLDVACGDWNWMRLVELGDVEYTGWDVDPGRIEKCRQRVATGDFAQVERPNTVFEVRNAITTSLEVPYDLVLARDFLAHLRTNDIIDVLNMLIASGSRLLLASTYPGADNDWQYRPEEFAWSGYMEHPVDLAAPPYNLVPTDLVIPEPVGPGGVLTNLHELRLFHLPREVI